MIMSADTYSSLCTPDGFLLQSDWMLPDWFNLGLGRNITLGI